jgi:aspartate 1-decarboxylase
MLKTVCVSKIHGAKVTKSELRYSGSIGIDKDLMKASGIYPQELVRVFNANNGQRFETYVIEEKQGSGHIALYGPASRLGQIGDSLVILSCAQMEGRELKKIKPKVVLVDKNNRISRK